MKLFHLFAVYPADQNAQGHNQVRYYDFCVFARSVNAAAAQIDDYWTPKEPGSTAVDAPSWRVKDAWEIWGIEIHQEGVLLDPHRTYHRLESLAQHEGWADNCGTYKLLSSKGRNALRHHFEDEYDRHLTEKYGTDRSRSSLYWMTKAGQAELEQLTKAAYR